MLTLTLRESLPHGIDVSDLSPGRLAALSVTEIGALALRLGNETHPLGEIFAISGQPPGDTVVLRDTDPRVHGIGTRMDGGQLVVEGDAGDLLGGEMRQGEIRVEGSCGDLACAEMRGGNVDIRGSAGDRLGAALGGNRVGIRGGTVIVRGNCGDRVGERQRRGTILIEGNAGDFAGCNMIAGTLAVLGQAGRGTGFGMRRGTLLLGKAPQSIPCTFNENGTQSLGFLALLNASLRHLDGPFGRLAERGHQARRWLGDRSCGGLGEILVWIHSP